MITLFQSCHVVAFKNCTAFTLCENNTPPYHYLGYHRSAALPRKSPAELRARRLMRLRRLTSSWLRVPCSSYGVTLDTTCMSLQDVCCV